MLEHGSLSGKNVVNKDVAKSILQNEVPKGVTVSSKAKNLAAQGGGGVFVRKDSIQKGVLNNPFIPEGDKNFIKKLTGKGKDGVAVSNINDLTMISHELGHAKNAHGKGLRKLISDKDPRLTNNAMVTGKGSLNYYPGGVTGEKVGFKQALKDFKDNIVNSGKVVAEETSANQQARKMLKKAGASKEELKQVKDIHSANTGTYKGVAKASIKSGLGRVINIPSRRGGASPML